MLITRHSWEAKAVDVQGLAGISI